MNKLYRLTALLALLLLTGISDAVAFGVSNLRFVADASGNATALARVSYACIDGWIGDEPTLTRDGQQLTLTLSNSPQLVCLTTPPPPVDLDFPLGNLEPGIYQVRLQQAPFQAGGEPIQYLSGSLTVGTGPYTLLRTIPQPARAFELVNARLRYNCTNGAAIAPPITTVAGDTITVRIPVTLDTCFVGVPPPAVDVDVPIGNVAPGNYTLVVLQESALPGVVIPALSTALSVTGAGGHSVPATNAWGLLLMAALLILVGWFSQRRRDWS